MLPIPALLIDSTSSISSSSTSASVFCNNNSGAFRNHRRFLFSFIYLGGTASLCYLFLFALVISNDPSSSSSPFHLKHNQSSKFNRKHFNSGGILQLLSQNSARQSYYWGSEGKKGTDRSLFGLSAAAASALSANHPPQQSQSPSSFHRKTLYTLSKAKHRKDGTWRSNPTKIWAGHQDLISPQKQQHHSKDKHYNGYDDKSKLPDSSEAYLYPWIDDEQCKRFRVQFAKNNTFKPRALVSFPGSGNSWLRYLIQSASGYFTGSVYRDKTLYSKGLWGEYREPGDGSTILQKTHHVAVGNKLSRLKEAETLFHYRGALIIRNPYDALVSWWHLLNSNSKKNRHKESAKEAAFHTVEWIMFVRKKIDVWTSLITTWLENSQDYLILLYEDIQKNPRQQLIEILGYLEQPVDSERLDCLMKPEHLEGPFHRRAHPAAAATTSLPQPTTAAAEGTMTLWQQQLKRRKRELPSSHHQNDERMSFILNSKKSQQDQQQHLHSPSSQTILTAEVSSSRRKQKGKEEQKEDKFLLSSAAVAATSALSSSSSTRTTLSSKTISSTPSLLLPQNQDDQINKGRSITISNNDNHQQQHDRNNNDNSNNNHHHQHLNNSSILRLDLIIQDNIDKINRFFQEKSIPLQLLYTLRPSIEPYFLLPLLNITTLSTTTSTNIFGL